MGLKSSILHLRIPFSYFLLPVFLFSLSLSPNFTANTLLWTFIIIHLFIYPASNGYNSYFDKDEKSIGVLKNPPPVSLLLYYLSLALDVAGIILAYLKINLEFALMLAVYGLVSKAYSHPSIRLKKYAITSWMITGIFQGVFTLAMCYIGVNTFSFDTITKPSLLWGGILTTLMLWANYPMTQIYQHEEDSKRGDNTMSILLGIKGTFYFTGLLFTLVAVGFLVYFNAFFTIRYGLVFLIAMLPVIAFFTWWFVRVLKDESRADFTHTMWLNFISATCLNAFFIYLFLDSTNLLQVFQ